MDWNDYFTGMLYGVLIGAVAMLIGLAIGGL